MRLLYITRKYPPTVGGMETVAYELYEELKGRADVQLVAIRSKHGGKSALLPFLYVGLFARAFKAAIFSRPDIIYIQDGVLGPLGWLLRVLLHLPVVVTVHGTEVAYQNPVYRLIVLPFLGRVTAGVAISSGTRDLAQKVLPKLPLHVINWGVRDEFYTDKPRTELRAELEQIRDAFNSLWGLTGRHPLFLVRLTPGSEPSARSLRLDLQDLLLPTPMIAG